LRSRALLHCANEFARLRPYGRLTVLKPWVQTHEIEAKTTAKRHSEASRGIDLAGFSPIFTQGETMPKVSMTVNGKRVSATVDSRTLLVDFLRSSQRLTGTHVGCDTSQCGACVIHVNGKAIKSCTTLAVACEGAVVATIEGLANGTELHPMQAAFRTHHGLQCGFCTPGMIMAAVDMVNRLGYDLSEETIRHELEGNICRCTGYHNIVKAIQAGAAAMGGMKIAAE
jgi:aerobic carbon-monoxide dehydrogenase small subunit